MLTGHWRAEENLCNREDYAFLRMTNQVHHLEALIAVFQGLADFLDPTSSNEHQWELSNKWSTGFNGEAKRISDQISWQNETPANFVGTMGDNTLLHLRNECDFLVWKGRRRPKR
jgi:hypothetical protein